MCPQEDGHYAVQVSEDAKGLIRNLLKFSPKERTGDPFRHRKEFQRLSQGSLRSKR